jgi:hypothetical protein
MRGRARGEGGGGGIGEERGKGGWARRSKEWRGKKSVPRFSEEKGRLAVTMMRQ